MFTFQFHVYTEYLIMGFGFFYSPERPVFPDQNFYFQQTLYNIPSVWLPGSLSQHC